MMATATESRIDQTLMALADPTRRAILRQLSDGKARVTELARPFDISLNAVSKHIRILERARLVRRRVDGREHFLAFNPKPLDDAVRWMETQRAFWAGRLDALEELLKAEDRAGAKTPKGKEKRNEIKRNEKERKTKGIRGKIRNRHRAGGGTL